MNDEKNVIIRMTIPVGDLTFFKLFSIGIEIGIWTLS